MQEIVVIGGGGHAKVLISVLRKTGSTILGYTELVDRGPLLGADYLGDDGMLPGLLAQRAFLGVVLGLGKIDASDTRLTVHASVTALGAGFPVIASPHAVINEEVMLGPGTVVFDGAVINSGARVGRVCILNTNSTLEHDCQLGDNVHLAPGATVSGGVSIGDNCMIGVGVNVIQGVSICPGCLIGVGSTVIHDIAVPGTYVGYPARRIR